MESEGIIVSVPASPSLGAEGSAAFSAEMVDPLVDAQRSNDEDKNQSAQTAASNEKDLRSKIIRQVEYYFGDENLPTDKFLMKHVKKDKNGWVSMSLIASFRKMKKLSKDISVIVDALRESSLLAVSADGKKVKRLNPLPINEAKDVKLCTVVAENLPVDHSKENLCKIFGKIGNVKRVFINDPYGEEDAKQKFKMDKLISNKLHALVEYDTLEAAEKAVAALTDEKDWRNGLQVQLLCKRMGYGIGRKGYRGSYSDQGTHCQGSGEAGDEGSHNEHHDLTNEDEDGEHMTKENNGRRGRNRRSRGQKHHGNNGMGQGTAVSSLPEALRAPLGPRMPDGTRGFTMGRGRPRMPDGTRGFTMGRGRPPISTLG